MGNLWHRLRFARAATIELIVGVILVVGAVAFVLSRGTNLYHDLVVVMVAFVLIGIASTWGRR